MNFYFAARYSRREELCGYRSQLEALGHKVTSRWLDGNHQAEADDVEAMRRFALEDLADLNDASICVAFTEPPRTPSTNRGGRHVEFGYALVNSIRVVVVGPIENVFHALPEVDQFDTFEDFLPHLECPPGCRD